MRLSIGDYSWIGEDVWIDNLSIVKIGRNVCISQGAYFFALVIMISKKKLFLICKSITVESQSWIGSKVIIGPGNTIGEGSVIKMGSIITKIFLLNQFSQEIKQKLIILSIEKINIYNENV